MRVLSFIPAFLLAAASFVAAAPTPTGTCVAAPTSTSGSGSGNDAPLQPAISIIADATTNLQGLCGQLTTLKGNSASCTPDAVSGILVQITATVKTCVSSLQATAKVDLDGLDLSNLCITISALLNVVLTILCDLVAIVGIIGSDALASIQAAVSDLLNAVLSLVGCLNIFVDASVTISAAVGAVITVVVNICNLCLSIFVGVGVSVQ